MRKILTFTIMILSLILCINVDAYTYIGDKKASFYEVEGEIDSAIFKFNDKYYNYDYKNDAILEMDFKNNILSKTDISQYNTTFMNEFLKGQKFTYYDQGEDEKFYAFHYEGSSVTKEEIPIDIKNLSYGGTKDNKLYFSDDNVKIYNLDGTLSQEIKADDIINQLDLSYSPEYTSLYAFVQSGELFYELTLIVNDNGIQKELLYTLDENFKQLFFIEEIEEEQFIFSTNIIKSNEGYKLIYNDCKDNLDVEPNNCTVKVMDENNKTTELLTSPGQPQIENFYGLIKVEDSSNYSAYIYDNNLNLIKTYEDINHLFLSLVLEKMELAFQFPEYDLTLEPNEFLVRISNFDNKNTESYKYELIKIENIEKVNITGTVTHEDGKDLKDYIVELHSTKRTFTLKSNGYFKFDSVEEDIHTLLVKDKEGNTLASKEINVIAAEETKLDGNTLYFNPKDNGVNINIKLTNTELTLSSIDKGTKEEPANNIVDALIPNVPETSDSLYLYMSLLAILVIFSVVVIKNIKKLKK